MVGVVGVRRSCKLRYKNGEEKRRERRKNGNGDNLVTGDSTSATGRKGWSICADRRGLIFGITMGLPGTFSVFFVVFIRLHRS